MATPSSRQVFRRAILGSSMSIVNGEYSTWTVEIGWTLQARRSDSDEHSLKPRYLTLPALKRVSGMPGFGRQGGILD